MEPIVLPYDVIGVIFEYLAANTSDQRDLQSCSLVCKDWVPIARQHIFQSVTVHLGRESAMKRVMFLMTIIHQQPSIRRLIQEIYCISTESTHGCRWSDPMFLNLLNLPCVRVLSIEVRCASDVPYDKWSTNKFGLRLLIEHYLGAGTVTDFRIISWRDMPITPIFLSEQLSSLDLRVCSFELETRVLHYGKQLPLKRLAIIGTRNVDSSIFHFLSLLEELTISMANLISEGSQHASNSSAFSPFYHLHTIKLHAGFKWSALCAPPDVIGTKLFPSLRKLDMRLMGADDIKEGNIIFDHLVALEDVHVRDCSFQRSIDFSSFDIHGLMYNSRKTLKKVSLDWSLNGYYGLEKFIKRMCDILELIQGDNALETLAFTLTYIVVIVKPDLNSDFPQWKRFADILQKSGGFSNLKQISFKIKLISTNDTVGQEANQHLEDLWDGPLAGLANSSLFSFQKDTNITNCFYEY